jgi:hypothetical protein
MTSKEKEAQMAAIINSLTKQLEMATGGSVKDKRSPTIGGKPAKK